MVCEVQKAARDKAKEKAKAAAKRKAEGDRQEDPREGGGAAVPRAAGRQEDPRVLGPRVSRRTSYEVAGRMKEIPPPYRRSPSLAELQGERPVAMPTEGTAILIGSFEFA